MLSREQIVEIIEEAEYEHYGLRACHDGFGEFLDSYVEPIVGETLPNSMTWEDGDSMGSELNGTSAIKVTAGNIDRALDLLSGYRPAVHFALIAGYCCEYGEDDGEIIINDCIVLAACKA